MEDIIIILEEAKELAKELIEEKEYLEEQLERFEQLEVKTLHDEQKLEILLDFWKNLNIFELEKLQEYVRNGQSS